MSRLPWFQNGDSGSLPKSGEPVHLRITFYIASLKDLPQATVELSSYESYSDLYPGLVCRAAYLCVRPHEPALLHCRFFGKEGSIATCSLKWQMSALPLASRAGPTWPPIPVRLQNGWKLDRSGFKPGYMTAILLLGPCMIHVKSGRETVFPVLVHSLASHGGSSAGPL